jgi:predicted HAD superfamily Cof-like phosphohydrolase
MTKSTNFQRVSEFNTVLGQGVAAAPNIPNMEQCNLRLALINEEALVELKRGFDERDLIKIADAVGDALVVVYGAANDCGLDADAILAEVHRSNMSKLCDSEADAVFAAEQYRAGNGFHGKKEPIEALYRKSPIEGKFIVFDARTGKTLKGPNFSEPNLESIVFPNGRGQDSFAALRDIAVKLGVGGAALWQFNSVLDTINKAAADTPAAQVETAPVAQVGVAQ